MTSRCGFIALVGEPNAGKSTLLNRFVGTKVSIVTHKVQTTRSRIRGVSLAEESQLIFIDTPGIFQPRRRLDTAMVAAAWGGVSDADVAVVLVEAHRGITKGVENILSGLANHDIPIVLSINKIDRVKAPVLLELTTTLNERFNFAATFMISATRGYGAHDLKNWLAQQVPEGPWLYPEDQVSDLPLRMIAAEMTREQLTLRLHQELPYQLTVETDKWEDRKDGSIRIDQIIYLEREGHKGIVLGHKGETIKAVSQAARKEIEALMDKPVHLFTQVKVRPGWLEDAQRYEAMGLDYKDGA